MKNPFKELPLTIPELLIWKNNSNINPRTLKVIKNNGYIYNLILKAYTDNKEQVDILLNQDVIVPKNVLISKNITFMDPSIYLIQCNEDRDPISMNIFWIEENNIKKLVYSKEHYDELIIYYDSKNIIRCFEKETLKYLKSYNMMIHPISMELLPLNLFDNIDLIDLNKIQNDKTLENIALDVFQYFSKISIFINYEDFLNLSKKELFKFNYELRDFWHQNFNDEQRSKIVLEEVLTKTENNMENDSLENIQKYLLNELKLLLQCEKEEYKYMINYIILGALGIVIPSIKESYPDFSFTFS